MDSDATENVERFLDSGTQLESLEIKAIMTRRFINKVLEIAAKPESKLKSIKLVQVLYNSHSLEDPESSELELRQEDFAKQWSHVINKLTVFKYEVIIRDEVTDDVNPKLYNQRLFARWRETLDLSQP